MPSISSLGDIALRAGSYYWRGSWRDLTAQVGPQVGIADGWWFNDHALCYAQVTDLNRIYTIDLESGEVTHWPAPGPNLLYSGGSVWASKGAGGYWDSWGPNPRWAQTAWTPYAVDNLTGAIAVLTADWQFCVYQGHPDPLQASLTVLVSGVQEYQASFANAVLTLYAGENWHHWHKADGLTYTGTLNRVQMDPGGRFCQDWNLGGSYFYGQVIWPDWTPTQAVQMPYVNNFNAKIYRATPTSPIIQVIGSRGAAELPGEQQIFTVNLTDQTLDGRPWTLVNVTQPPPDPPVPPIPLESDMIVLKRSRLSVPSKNFPGRQLCLMNNGQFLHVDPATMGMYQSPSDDDKAAWITTSGSGAARLEIEAYFIEAKVDEKA